MSATVQNHNQVLHENSLGSSTWQEQLSACADGQLSDAQYKLLWQQLQGDDCLLEAQQDWNAWHLAGEVLRASSHARYVSGETFLLKFRDRLAQESLQHAATAPPQLIKVPDAPVAQPGTEAANASVLRCNMMAGVASLAAVAAIGWGNLSQWQSGGGQGVQLAQAGGETTQVAALGTRNQAPISRNGTGLTLVSQTGGLSAGAEAGQVSNVMIRDARLDELLARQYGNTVALQPPAAFLRNTNLPSSLGSQSSAVGGQ